jgi:hypothetical protein
MTNAWIFIRKGMDGKIIKAELYGSLRKMSNNREIIIGGRPKSEQGLRYLFKDRDEYQDENLFISKLVVRKQQRNI